MKDRNKYLCAVIGAQRSGKSHLVNQLAQKQYLQNKFAVIVYNWSGQPADFSSYYAITPLDSDQIEALPERILADLYYKENDLLFTAKLPNGDDVKDAKGKLKVFSFKFLNRDFYGKGVKMLSMNSAAQFFNNIDYYVSNALVVIDDAKPVVAHGLGEQGINLVRRLNHAGSRHVAKNYKNGGVDCIFIFHDIDDIRTGIYSALNYIILFKTTSKPVLDYLKKVHPQAAQDLAAGWEKLQKAPQYTHIQINYSPITKK